MGTTRGKSSPKSTPGSFAPGRHDEPGTGLDIRSAGHGRFAPDTAFERSLGVAYDPGFVTARGKTYQDTAEVLVDYRKWQARAHQVELGLVRDDPEADRKANVTLAAALVRKLRSARNVDHDDPDWDPEAIFDRHPHADGPSLDEMVDEFDRWEFRDQTLHAAEASVGRLSVEARQALYVQMEYLVHALAHRAERSGR